MRSRWLAWTPPAPDARYRPQLDGLRAVAITMVLVAHFLDSSSEGGRLGVRLFFVLSGYLITRMLLDARKSGARLTNFYIRRALRLWPAYYVLLGLLLLIGTAGLREVAPWHLFYASNILFALRGDYLRWYAAPWWSLATEEQFYLVWPMVVLLAGRRFLIAVCLACLPLGLAWRMLGTAQGWGDPATLLVLPALIDALAVGALLAVFHDIRSGPVPGLRAVGILGALGWLAVRLAGRLSSPWAESIDMFAFVAAVDFAACGGGGVPGRLLMSRPFSYVGRISYGLYLFHMPVWYGLLHLPGGWRLQHPGPALFAAGCAATFAVASASWFFLEAPASRLKRRFPFP